jgi:hypothetical protein
VSNLIWANLGLVVIGRNEGERLRRCFLSTPGIAHRIYVDSGSSDGSIEAALSEGFEVVRLQAPPQFTAARARNAGLQRLLELQPDVQFVQMVDGDCQLQPGWIEAARQALAADARLALVFGRRRERHPERSIYNALCDDEWNVPVGEAAGCGGDAMFRIQALRQVAFYNPAMIAGEDSELSMRLRKAGWQLRRIDAEMTLHDAAMTRFAQWWQRTRRSGHGFGEMAHLHPDARDPNWPRTVRSITTWGALLPTLLALCVLLGVLVSPYAWLLGMLLALLWPLKMLQLAQAQRRRGLPAELARASGVLLMLGKLPQMLGLLGYHYDRLSGRASRLIEYH